MDKLISFLSSYPVVLGDGAMGTMLHAAGLAGGAPEEWNVTHPDAVRAIYQGYVDAGSQVITTNSFGGNSFRLGLHDLRGRVRELNVAAARLARAVADAAGRPVLVAGSIGPSGQILFPLGKQQPDEVRAAFAEQALALHEGGVDFFLIETMSALEEIREAVAGCRLSSSLPIAVTLTFDTRGRTMMGIAPKTAVQALYDMGIRVMGANCGNGPDETEQVAVALAAVRPADVYLVTQSNAGLPKVVDQRIVYDATPEVMAAYARRMKELGINYIGGCCGTTPAHIAAMAAALEQG